jgi:hypothetical protein
LNEATTEVAMQLSPNEVELLYRLVQPLHLYAGQQVGLWPATATIADLRAAGGEAVFQARDAAYTQPEILESFIQSNPAGLTPGELDRVRQWRHLVVGDFYIERLLKKGAVFIEYGEGGRVFLVCANAQPWDERIPPYALPLWVSTVLLPFAGRIVTDGLMRTYSIHFGGGISRQMREIYLTAKQNDQLITTLPPAQPAAAAPMDRTAPWAVDADAIVAAVARLRGGPAPVHAPALKVLAAAAQLASLAAHHPADVDALWKAADDVYRGYDRMCKVLKRSQG